MVEIEIKSNYELINELKRLNLFNKMIRNGLVSLSFDSYHSVYEYYLNISKTIDSKADVIGETALEFNISERSVYVIINKMK